MAAGLNSSPNKGMQGKARVAMVGLVITIAQRKGGAGKTTLATQLAVAWARCGARVAALDIDPQGSFSTWVDLRRARLGAKAIGFDFAALPGWRAAQWVDDRVGSADLVVIDAPPHAETEARIAVRVARLVVVPVQPSPLDLWATAETLKMAQDERRRSLVVLNSPKTLPPILPAPVPRSRRPGSATVLHWRKRWRWGLASSKTPV
jgi:cellulose biosynthesis protein BcsQ